jgi:hypothetical protein
VTSFDSDGSFRLVLGPELAFLALFVSLPFASVVGLGAGALSLSGSLKFGLTAIDLGLGSV